MTLGNEACADLLGHLFDTTADGDAFDCDECYAHGYRSTSRIFLLPLLSLQERKPDYRNPRINRGLGRTQTDTPNLLFGMRILPDEHLHVQGDSACGTPSPGRF